MNRPFKLIVNDTIQFLFLFRNADAFYQSSRYSLQRGLIAPGCSNAHQSIELYIKAILKLNHEQERGHDLVKLLKKFENRDSYFKLILNNSNLLELLQELSNAYLIFRYGEAGAESNSKEIIQQIDELAYNLRKIYLRKIGWSSTKIYISKNAKEDFLRNNEFFKEEDLTHNPLASMGLPFGNIFPESHFN